MTPSDHARNAAPSRDTAPGQADTTLSDPSLGWVLAVELVTATLVWGGIGWLLDRWLGTAPWLMAIGFVVGNGAGIYLVWLRTNEASQPPVRPRPRETASVSSVDATREGEPVAND